MKRLFHNRAVNNAVLHHPSNAHQSLFQFTNLAYFHLMHALVASSPHVVVDWIETINICQGTILQEECWFRSDKKIGSPLCLIHMWATGHNGNMENSAETLRIRILATDDLMKQPREVNVLHYRLYSRMNTVNIRSFHAAQGFLQAHHKLLLLKINKIYNGKKLALE